MTPDERADRAERVIAETGEQLRALASWFGREELDGGRAAADALDFAADMLERNARIAGILNHRQPPGRPGGSSGLTS